MSGLSPAAARSQQPRRTQVAQAEAGGEESGAAGGSGTLPQAGAGGAAGETHEGPAVRGRQALQVLRAHAAPVLNTTQQSFAKDSKFVTLLCWNVDFSDL